MLRMEKVLELLEVIVHRLQIQLQDHPNMVYLIPKNQDLNIQYQTLILKKKKHQGLLIYLILTYGIHKKNNMLIIYSNSNLNRPTKFINIYFIIILLYP